MLAYFHAHAFAKMAKDSDAMTKLHELLAHCSLTIDDIATLFNVPPSKLLSLVSQVCRVLSKFLTEALTQTAAQMCRAPAHHTRGEGSVILRAV